MNAGEGNLRIAVFDEAHREGFPDGELDKNILGIPKEPYGFSGKWKSGGSSFDKALFNTDEVGFAISITLK
ncbi:MAG: DUF2141 domain-containing protein [Gammaproteobacteria bacterium]|nr:DUF2141 domain-containing protein [Gammaproteobacteria bacterium]